MNGRDETRDSARLAGRLSDRPPEGRDPEAVAGALLRKVQAPQPLGPGRLAAIERAIDDRIRRPHAIPYRRFALAGVFVSVLAGVAGAAMWEFGRGRLGRGTVAAPPAVEPARPAARARAVPSYVPLGAAEAPAAAAAMPGDVGGAPAAAEAPAAESRPAAPWKKASATKRLAYVAPAPSVPDDTAAAPGPAEASPAVAPSGESAIAEEARLLGQAVQALRKQADPGLAVSLLDAYRARFPRGVLAREAALARVDALRALGRDADALAALDALDLDSAPRGRQLRVLRAELRAEAGRCPDALRDFGAVLAIGIEDEPGGRALWGRASCRLRAGDETGARADLSTYLTLFPAGPRAREAARLIGR